MGGTEEAEHEAGRRKAGAESFRSHPDEIAYLTGRRLPGQGQEVARLALATIRRLRADMESGATVSMDALNGQLRLVEQLIEQLV